MKTVIFALCLFAAVVTASAQDNRQRGPGGQPGGPGGPPPNQPLPENYVLNLTVRDREQIVAEMSLVVATTDFSASAPDAKPAINGFNGTLALEEGGTVLVRYTLNIELSIRPNGPNPQTKTSTTQSSIRLRLGEQVQILRADTRTCRLSIIKLSDQAAVAR